MLYIVYIWGAYTFGYYVGWPSTFTSQTAAAIAGYDPQLFTKGTWAFGTSPARYQELIVGIIVAVAVTVLRFKFLWFPVDPIGLIIGAHANWTLMFWFTGLLAFVAKYVVLRIGGTKLYEEKGIPIALGLIIGHALCYIVYGLTLAVMRVV